MIADEIKELLQKIASEMNLSSRSFSVEPAVARFGDYTSNIAMLNSAANVATAVGTADAATNPRALAEKISAAIMAQKPGFIENVQVAGPGFINFYLTRNYFSDSIIKIFLNSKTYGANDSLAGQKIMIEYTDPNPFKIFHIGHLMANAVGESLARLMEWGGAEVIRANYQGDVGMHVAKALWAMRLHQAEFPLEGDPLIDRVNFISQCYVEGSTAYEKNTEAKIEIDIINKQVYERSDENLNQIYDFGRAWTLEHFEEIYRKLSTKFDYYFFESQVAKLGTEIVQEFLAKGLFRESQGAIIFPGENYGLHTRVFINSHGIPTYEGKELGLDTLKFEKEPKLDQSIIITANEQDDYLKVVLEAFKHINKTVAEKTKHISHGMLRFAEGKMSSRKGNIITGESLLISAEEKIHELMVSRDYLTAEKADIVEKVSVAAIKYSILKQSIGSDIIYDFEKSLSFEGDSGPYLQYTYARTCSILEKAETEDLAPGFTNIPTEILDLEKIIVRFPQIVKRALNDYAPHYIATYLIELARAFNSFYAETKIINPEDPLSEYRLAITSATSIVLKNGLSILGISAPTKM